MQTNEQLLSAIENYLAQTEFPAEPELLYAPIGYSLAGGGKRLRPMLLMLSNGIFTDKIQHALPAAAAVEVFHNFTLLHDDIMDNAAVRRGKPSVYAKWGQNVAILSGDAMLICAYRLLGEVPAQLLPQILSTFNTMALEVCEGQQYDMDFERKPKVSVVEYMHMIELKTSVLLAGSVTIGAMLGGAMFGDNLSFISDTTIAATKGAGCEMKDKFKMNFFIALPAAIVAMILYSIFGGVGSGAIEAGSYSIIEVLPYFIVLIAALMGVNVAVVLFVGILASGIIGLCVGSCGFFEWIQAIGSGMSDMFSISIVAILVSGIIGLVREYGGVEWLVGAISSKIKSRRGAEYGIGLMSGILSAAMVNNTIAIIVTCPIAKEIGEKYKIAPKRLASLVDIFACAFIALMPHDGGMLMITALADVSPLNVLKYSFYMFGLIIATCVTIQFGLMDKKN